MTRGVASPGPNEPCPPEPPAGCTRCARLSDYRAQLRRSEPAWHNDPVASFGDPAARLLIVGLAPGARGANRTGRPFTGDGAGELLYPTLLACGLATGTYKAAADDGLMLRDAMITNAVRCVPPENRPTPREIDTCRPYLSATVDALPRLAAIVALGRIAHESTLLALGRRKADHAFAHGARHAVRDGLVLFDSFHCSRYNTSTRKLTPEMFRAVFDEVCAHLGRRVAS